MTLKLVLFCFCSGSVKYIDKSIQKISKYDENEFQLVFKNVRLKPLVTQRARRVGEGHCVLKWGYTQTFPGNKDATVKSKSELILIFFFVDF